MVHSSINKKVVKTLHKFCEKNNTMMLEKSIISEYLEDLSPEEELRIWIKKEFSGEFNGKFEYDFPGERLIESVEVSIGGQIVDYC